MLMHDAKAGLLPRSRPSAERASELYSSNTYGGPKLLRTTAVMASTTKSNTPPPGANRRT